MIGVIPWFIFNVSILWGLVLLLHKIGVSKRQAIFVSVLLFGVFGGFIQTQQTSHGELMSPSRVLGDEIHSRAEDHWTDPSAPYERPQIPWFLQTPQVYFLTTTILWGFMGLVLQGGYIYFKKPPDTKTRSTLLVTSCLVAYLAIATLLVYATS